MSGPAAAYLVAFSAMLFAAISALTLIHTVNHFDLEDVRSEPGELPAEVAV